MIARETPIIDILRGHPQGLQILNKHGMGCGACLGSNTETIENGARMHDVDIAVLLQELNEIYVETKNK